MTGLQLLLERALSSDGWRITAVVDRIIDQAVQARASDIHLEPTRDALEVSYRIDGVLQSVAALPRTTAENIVTRIKVMAGLVTYRTDIPQDGRISAQGVSGDLRVSILPTLHGEKAVVRLFQRKGENLSLDDLGFPEDIRGALQTFLTRSSGVLFLTGPSGSGKTTTIYGLLRSLSGSSHRRRSIITIEDPVEQDIHGVTQTQVHPVAGFTFASGLRAVLRQDPEVIVVGEVRDQETAKIAIEAGLTGHLVISTVHSGTSCGVFTRLLEMGIEPYLLTSSLTAVLAQRLLRKLCPSCKRPAQRDHRFQGIALPAEATPHDPAGCDSCYQTGYAGRTPVVEMLPVSEEMRGRILARSPLTEFESCAAGLGLVDLCARGLSKLAAGETSVDELHRVLPLLLGQKHASFARRE